MDFRHLLEQAKNLERALADVDQRLQEFEATGTAGGGVTIRINGAGDVLGVSIEKELLDLGEPALVEQAVTEALRKAMDESRCYREEQRKALTGGLKLPDF